MSEATTSRPQNRRSNPNSSGDRPTRTTSSDEQATMRHHQPVVSSSVPDKSRTESDHAQSEARRRQRTQPLHESTSSSDSDSKFSPKLPSNMAPLPQSDRPRRNNDSAPRRATTSSTPPISTDRGANPPSTETASVTALNLTLPSARPQRHSVSGKRNEEGVGQQAVSSSSAYPPISSRNRRRSSRSLSRRKERRVD
jgi:hypothetical protein